MHSETDCVKAILLSHPTMTVRQYVLRKMEPKMACCEVINRFLYALLMSCRKQINLLQSEISRRMQVTNKIISHAQKRLYPKCYVKQQHCKLQFWVPMNFSCVEQTSAATKSTFKQWNSLQGMLLQGEEITKQWQYQKDMV